MTHAKFKLQLSPKYLSENADCDANQQWHKQNMFICCLALNRWSVLVPISTSFLGGLYQVLLPISASVSSYNTFFSMVWFMYFMTTLRIVFTQLNSILSISWLTHLKHTSEKDWVSFYFELSELMQREVTFYLLHCKSKELNPVQILLFLSHVM